MFLSLVLPSEYRIQHGAIGPLYVTSSYSTWIFCRGVSGFATDCPCDVGCRGLTTYLLHVGPRFGNRFLNTSWVVGLTYWRVYLHFLYFDTCNYICTSYHFWLYLYFLNILYFFKYSCTNIFHKRSLCTFYGIAIPGKDGHYIEMWPSGYIGDRVWSQQQFASSPKHYLEICVLHKSNFVWHFQAETLYVCPKHGFGHTYKVLARNSHHKCDIRHCIFSRDYFGELPKH